MLHLLQPLHHEATALGITAERALSRAQAGSCNVPLGGCAQISGANLRLRGYVGAPDGTRHVSAEVSGAAADAEALGMKLAQMLKGMGADSILAALALT